MSHNLQAFTTHLRSSITKGQIHLVLPNDKMLTFTGKHKGPTATWLIHNWQCIDDIIKEGPSALPSTYAKKLWNASNLIDFLTVCFQNNLLKCPKKQSFWPDFLNMFKKSITPYDALFDQFLDQCCADQISQYRQMINQSPPNTRILDMGCDGGNFAKFAARNGHHVTALTLSKDHYQKAKGLLQKDIELGRVSLIQNPKPHTNMHDQYDLITAFGLFEYLRMAEWSTLLKTIKNTLSTTGCAFIQSVFVPSTHPHYQKQSGDYLQKYLFHNNALPSINTFKRQATKYDLELTQIQPLGSAYIHHLERVYKAIMEQENQHPTLMRSLQYCCACLIAAIKTDNANIMHVQLKHLRVKDNVVQLAI